MKLIFEDLNLFDTTIELNESTGVKRYILRGIFSTIGEKNKNGRMYGMDIWKSEVEKYQKIMNSGSNNSLMEYKHPPRSCVEPMEAVGKMLKLHIEGKYVMGEAVLLDNPKANQLKTLIDNGIKISVSSRGLGDTDRFNNVIRYKLITYDIVPDPSDYNATMNGMCESYSMSNGIVEGLNFDNDGNIVEEKLSKKEINKHISDKFKVIFSKLGKNQQK